MVVCKCDRMSCSQGVKKVLITNLVVQWWSAPYTHIGHLTKCFLSQRQILLNNILNELQRSSWDTMKRGDVRIICTKIRKYHLFFCGSIWFCKDLFGWVSYKVAKVTRSMIDDSRDISPLSVKTSTQHKRLPLK